jgi:hypothetical protein
MLTDILLFSLLFCGKSRPCKPDFLGSKTPDFPLFMVCLKPLEGRQFGGCKICGKFLFFSGFCPKKPLFFRGEYDKI